MDSKTKERLARLEAHQKDIRNDIREIKNHLSHVNKRVWGILSAVILGILLQILFQVL